MSRPPWSSWSSWQWEGPVCVAFGYARHGWVQLALLTPACGQSVVIDCSDVHPPFQRLLTWLHALADARLPATLTIDEEGVFTSLCALATEHRDDTIEFAVIQHDSLTPEPDAEPALRCRVSRLGLVREFARRLERWIEEDYDPAEFGRFDIEPGDPPHPEDLRRLDLGPLWAHLQSGRGDGGGAALSS